MDRELYLELEDTEWAFDYTNHTRVIARAVVFDDAGSFYFVHGERDDDYGKAAWIETAGGGVEPGEDLREAVKRELSEDEKKWLKKIAEKSDLLKNPNPQRGRK